MHLLRFWLPLAVLLSGASGVWGQAAYYYRLTGLTSGTCAGTTGAVYLAGATITRSAYLPSGDLQTATMTSSTGGFAIGNPSYNFSIGPVGPDSAGIFQSGVTTTPGSEPVRVDITIHSNVAPSFTARITCEAAMATPQFSVVTDTNGGIVVPTLHPGALLALSLLLCGLGVWRQQRIRREPPQHH